MIRRERVEDFNEVYDVVKAAFATAECSDGKEQDLVVALRNSDAYVPELSLVAEVDGKIVGHIMFTEAEVGNRTELVLAPLAVLPEYQRQGIGTALIVEGHRIARELGYCYSVVLGSEKYYSRFGYIPAVQMGIEVPDGFSSINFMTVKLTEDAGPVEGGVKYAKEFGI